MAFHVRIEEFDGPLDLMLHLIKEKKLDLFDLDITQLTDQYVAYLRQMERLSLEIASEYLTELATLIEYKSKRLLPKEESNLEAGYEEDPREKLMRRLIEYQKFKDVTPLLETRLEERNLLYTRPQSEIPSDWLIDDGNIRNLDVYDLLKSISKMYQRIALQQPLQSRFTVKEVSVDDRIISIRHVMSVSADHMFALHDILAMCASMQECVVTFLALLDMARNAELHFIVQGEDISVQKGELKYEEPLA